MRLWCGLTVTTSRAAHMLITLSKHCCVCCMLSKEISGVDQLCWCLRQQLGKMTRMLKVMRTSM